MMAAVYSDELVDELSRRLTKMGYAKSTIASARSYIRFYINKGICRGNIMILDEDYAMAVLGVSYYTKSHKLMTRKAISYMKEVMPDWVIEVE